MQWRCFYFRGDIFYPLFLPTHLHERQSGNFLQLREAVVGPPPLFQPMPDERQGKHYTPCLVAVDKRRAVSRIHDTEDGEMLSIPFLRSTDFLDGHVVCGVSRHDLGDVSLFGAPFRPFEGCGVTHGIDRRLS